MFDKIKFNSLLGICFKPVFVPPVLFYRFGPKRAGVINAFVLLCVLGFILNGPAGLVKAKDYKKKETYTIYIRGVDVEGARLWVNGIELGELPYKTTPKEFLKKVPYWPEKPKEPNEGPGTEYHIFYSPYSKPSKQPLARWISFTIPDKMLESVKGISSDKDTEKERTYYAQVKLGDEWAVSGGGRGAGGGFYSDFSVKFPVRQRRLERLIDKVRLADYIPTPEWFKAMETYRTDGYTAVYAAMVNEPRMKEVIDAWARWKYGLERAVNEKTALKVFDELTEKVEEDRFYRTDGLSGKAVEIIATKLNPNVMVSRAVKFFRRGHALAWGPYQRGGRWQFACGADDRGRATGSHRMWVGRGGMMKITDAVLVHAVWVLDQKLDKEDDTKANVIEKKVVPVFMAYYSKLVELLKFAALIDAEQVAQYAIKHDWRAQPDDLKGGQTIDVDSEEVNGWLYLLTILDCPTAKKFRKDNEKRIFEMTDLIVSEGFGSINLDEGLTYLFRDNAGTTDSLAWKYWKRFVVLADKRHHYPLKVKLAYLERLEPLATVDMYAEAWRSCKGDDTDYQHSLGSYKGALPEQKRLAICKAFKDEYERDPRNVIIRGSDDPERVKKGILRDINSFGKRHAWDDLNYVAKEYLEQLRTGKGHVKPEPVRQWLANEIPYHPLVGMLADCDVPRLRKLVPDVVKAHPTPQNRAILEKLLKDEDAAVREAAKKVKKELEELNRRDSGALVSSAEGGEGGNRIWLCSAWTARTKGPRGKPINICYKVQTVRISLEGQMA